MSVHVTCVSAELFTNKAYQNYRKFYFQAVIQIRM